MSEVYLLYLSGPIKGLCYEEATNWREYVASKLPENIKCVSPMRGKDYLKKEKSIKAGYENITLSTAKGITRRDRFDTKRSDAMLINLLGAKEVSIGSIMEMGWADNGIRPVVLVMEKESNPHDHPMVRETAAFVVDNLDEAIDLIIKILLP